MPRRHTPWIVAALVVVVASIALPGTLRAQSPAAAAPSAPREISVVAGRYYGVAYHDQPATVVEWAPGFIVGARGARTVRQLFVLDAGLSWASTRFDPQLTTPPAHGSAGNYGIADIGLALQLPVGPFRPFVGSAAGVRAEWTPYASRGRLFTTPFLVGARAFLPGNVVLVGSLRTWETVGRDGQRCAYSECPAQWIVGIGRRL